MFFDKKQTYRQIGCTLAETWRNMSLDILGLIASYLMSKKSLQDQKPILPEIIRFHLQDVGSITNIAFDPIHSSIWIPSNEGNINVFELDGSFLFRAETKLKINQVNARICFRRKEAFIFSSYNICKCSSIDGSVIESHVLDKTLQTQLDSFDRCIHDGYVLSDQELLLHMNNEVCIYNDQTKTKATVWTTDDLDKILHIGVTQTNQFIEFYKDYGLDKYFFRIIDVHGDCIRKLNFPCSELLDKLCENRHKQWFFTCLQSNTILVMDSTNGQVITQFSTFDRIHASPRGMTIDSEDRILIGHENGTVSVFAFV